MRQGVSKENARTDAEHARLRAEHLAGPCPKHPNDGPTCWHNATDDELRQVGKAIMLAPTLEVCEALLRGETVPIGRLNLEWVRKLGHR